MTDDFVSATPVLERDRWDRPLVIPVGGGDPVAYTRATTYVDGIDDKTNISKLNQRQVAIGVAGRPDLQLAVLAHSDESEKRALQAYCEEAKSYAGGDAKATTGTAKHKLTELIDRGQDLPPGLPDAVVASLEAYRAATAHLTYTHIEAFCVQDFLKVGGTPDRIGGKIVDLKTGSLEWGYVKIAAQLAMYARSRLYDIATGKRTDHGADLLEGTVIHLPVVEDPADAVCTLYDVDLKVGWAAVLTCRDIREKRAYKFADVFHPHGQAKPPVDDGKTDKTLHQILANPAPAVAPPTPAIY